MFAINIIGAGVPGFLIVFFPSFAEQYVLWEGQDYAVMTILGSIWLSIGLVSMLGTVMPYRFLPVFIVQLVYKTIWLVTFILPNLLAQNALPGGTKILIAIFGLLIVEFVLFVRPADFKMATPAVG